MKKISFFLTLCIISLFSDLIAQSQSDLRQISFDAGWLFTKTNIASGPENINFDASSWRKLDLPHDWSIEDLPNQAPESVIGPFSKDAIGTINSGYTVGGTAWYRKTFKLTREQQGKTVYIQFDGVYMNSDVWINGHHLGNHPYGYTPFYFDLTPYLQPAGKENVIAVQVKNEGVNSRWYSGSGIYRHVWLTVVNPVHVDVFGVYVTTPKATNTSAEVQIVTTIKNIEKTNATVTLQTQLTDGSGKIAAKAIQEVTASAGGKTDVKQNIALNNPKLWSPATPVLYKAETTVLTNGKVTDKLVTTFGVRDIKIDAQHGLLVNGERVILKGGCIHHDNGPIGSATIDRAEERKIEILKANGFNAIRTSHNSPSPYLLDVCDRLGMLVLDEAFDMWIRKKNPDDYHLYFNEWWNRDLTSMILRDRNHPSVILWSVGNEIAERADTSGMAIRKKLVNRVHELDPSRLVTEAICRTPQWEEKTPRVFQGLDVGGYNYKMDRYEDDHKSFPERIMVGTETYQDKVLENFTYAEQNPYVLGDFVWTAIDYIGETGVGVNKLDSVKIYRHNLGWPWFNANCGSIDLVGNKKPSSYYRDVVWRRIPLAMAVHSPIPEGMVENISTFGWPDESLSWTWPEAKGKALQVRVFSRAPLVRLLLNGKLIGEKKIKEGEIVAQFKVAFEPGVLKAVNVENGKETDAFELKTAGTPVAIRLTTDRTKIKADRNDLSYISVEVIDDKGQVVPNADVSIQFSVSGNGELAGVGNGNPTDLASFQQPTRKTWKGKCLAILRPFATRGNIRLKADSKGLQGAEIAIKAY